MTTRYAENTTVNVYQSRAEIEKILNRYGADQYAYMSSENTAIIAFRIGHRQYKMTLPLPDRNSRAFTHHSRGPRTQQAAEEAWEQACRSRWRALALVIKAKLEAVAVGISTVEREFLGNTVMSDGRTLHEWAEPQIEQMYLSGRMPAMLPMLTAKEAS